MAKTSFLSLTGLQVFVEKLYARGFNGMGLSQENFTSELKAKLESTATTEGLKQLNDEVTALKALVAADSDGAINKFNEIVAFLENISDTKTLEGLMSDIATQIADAKKAGTDAAAALATYKTEAEAAFVKNEAFSAYKGTVYTKTEADGKFATSGDLDDLGESVYSKTDADGTFIKSADLVAITDAEINGILNPA